MSRVGKKPVSIPEKVKVSIAGTKVSVEGPKGKMEMAAHPRMQCAVANNEVVVTRPTNSKPDRELHGLTRSLINNLV